MTKKNWMKYLEKYGTSENRTILQWNKKGYHSGSRNAISLFK